MELKLINIVNRDLDEERVVIKVLQKCNTNNFVLFDTTYLENGIASNAERHLFILPTLNIEVGDYIWIFTKSGTYATHKNTSNTTTHKLYWGLGHSIWNNSGDRAYLLHYDDWESLATK